MQDGEIQWPQHFVDQIPKSICSEECQKGYFKVSYLKCLAVVKRNQIHALPKLFTCLYWKTFNNVSYNKCTCIVDISFCYLPNAIAYQSMCHRRLLLASTCGQHWNVFYNRVWCIRFRAYIEIKVKLWRFVLQKVHGSIPCCWVCQQCRENEIMVDSETCTPCDLGWWPDDNITGMLV